jgi:hypothetical protein
MAAGIDVAYWGRSLAPRPTAACTLAFLVFGQAAAWPGVDAGARVLVTGRVANGRQWVTPWRCRLAAGRQRCSGSSPAAGRWQPHRRPGFGCGQRPGALAKQVTQAVAAAGGRRDQMLVIRSLQVAAGGSQAGARQRRGGVGIDAAARLQALLAKQPPRPAGRSY